MAAPKQTVLDDMSRAIRDDGPSNRREHRTVVLLSAAEKQRLEGLSRTLGVSIGEVVRRALASYDPEAEQSLTALLSTWRESTHRAIASVEIARRQVQAATTSAASVAERP